MMAKLLSAAAGLLEVEGVKMGKIVSLKIIFLLSVVLLTASFGMPQVLPDVIYSVPPVISPDVIMANTSGLVKVEVKIDQAGIVKDAVVTGHPFLHSITLDAVKRWKFAIAENSSDLQTVRMTWEYHPYEKIIIVKPYNLYLRPTPPCPSEEYIDAKHKAAIKIDEVVSEKCAIHHVSLKRDIVPIAYGLMGYRRGFLKAQQRYFPNDNQLVGGGCVINLIMAWGCTVHPPKFTMVSYCQKCRIAAHRWAKLHKNEPLTTF